MTSPSSESALIADQLRRAFEGDAWHGPALLELLQDVDAATAAARPLDGVHSIWELMLHVAAWDDAAFRRLGGEKVQLTGTANFPVVPKPTQATWHEAVAHAKHTHDVLVKTVAALPEVALARSRSGEEIRFLFHAARSGATRALSRGADCHLEEGASSRREVSKTWFRLTIA